MHLFSHHLSYPALTDYLASFMPIWLSAKQNCSLRLPPADRAPYTYQPQPQSVDSGGHRNTVHAVSSQESVIVQGECTTLNEVYMDTI